MSGLAYPRDRIETCLIEAVLPLSYRIIPGNYLTSPLGTAPADSRFCTKADGYTVLYASPDFGTAFIETVVRDRFTRRRRREVAIQEVTERACALIATKSGIMLRLLDLRRDGCALIGAPTDTVNARNHAAGRAFGRVIHADYADIDSLRRTQEPHSHPHGPANNATVSNAALPIVIQAGFTNVPEAIDHYRGISRSSMTMDSVRKTCWPRIRTQTVSIASKPEIQVGLGSEWSFIVRFWKRLRLSSGRNPRIG